MKSIVLAAGNSSRMAEVSNGLNKSLVPYKGKTIANSIVDILNESGVYDIAFVVKPSQLDKFKDSLPKSVEYYLQSEPTGHADAFYLAKDFVENSASFISVFGKCFASPSDVKVLTSSKPTTIMTFFNKTNDTHGRIKNFPERPNQISYIDYGPAQNNYVQAGYNLFDHAIFSSIEKMHTPAGHDRKIDYAINHLIGKGVPVYEMRVGWAKSFVTPWDLRE